MWAGPVMLWLLMVYGVIVAGILIYMKLRPPK